MYLLVHVSGWGTLVIDLELMHAEDERSLPRRSTRDGPASCYWMDGRDHPQPAAVVRAAEGVHDPELRPATR